MSTEIRLARLGLLHLVEDHEALIKALEAKQHQIQLKNRIRRAQKLNKGAASKLLTIPC